MTLLAVSSWIILCFVLAGLSLLGAGLMAGYWLARQQVPQVDPGAETRKVMRELSRLAQHLNGECSSYQLLMNAVSDEVERMGATSDTSALQRMLDELNAKNRVLRSELGNMQAELDGKTQEVQTLVSESRTDALTGLPNRRCFNEQIQHRIGELSRYGGDLCFVILDVDHFKKFNDNYGHLLGDEVLKAVGRVMQATVRDSDIPTRLGGEEFGVLMPAVGLHEAAAAADRLRRAIENCVVEHEGQALRVTASMGVTQVAPNDLIDAVVERADQALYAAKEGGRNAVWFWQDDELKPHLRVNAAASAINVPAEMRQPSLALRESLMASLDR